VNAVAGNARGIDVSNFAGEFNWDGTSGLTFGICRASQGLGAAGTNSPDPFLTWNWPRIKARGLARGAYHFLDPRLDGAAQASYFVEQLNKVGLDTTDMLWLDNETPGASPAAVAACARDFMTRLSALRPHNPRGVYSFFSFITAGNCAGLRSYPLWLAIFQSAAPSAPAPWSAWRFWQSGAASSHDNDVFNGTPAELAAWIAPLPGPEEHRGDLGQAAGRGRGHRRLRGLLDSPTDDRDGGRSVRQRQDDRRRAAGRAAGLAVR
jgi:lysozyme